MEKPISVKDKILRVMAKLPANATIDEAIYRLEFLKSIMQGQKEADEGLGMDHEEFFSQLLNYEKNETDLAPRRTNKP